MKHVLNCRRTFLALVGILILGYALISGRADTSTAIASICIGLAGSNAFEKKQLPVVGKK